MPQTQDLLETVAMQRTSRGLLNSVAAATKNFGFDVYSFYTLRHPEPGCLFPNFYTYPDTWLDHYYNAQHNFFDVAPLRAWRAALPYSWRSLYEDASTSPRQRLIFDEARAFGLKQGVAIPINGLNGQLALLSMAGDMAEKEFDAIWDHKRVDFALLGAYIGDTCFRIYQDALNKVVE